MDFFARKMQPAELHDCEDLELYIGKLPESFTTTTTTPGSFICKLILNQPFSNRRQPYVLQIEDNLNLLKS